MEAPLQSDENPCPTCGVSPSAVRHLLSIVKRQSEEIEELKREVAELKQRLSYYENSNSPPSKNSLLYREMRSKRREERQQQQADRGVVTIPVKKPGRKNGHEGVTQVFKPTESVIHTMDRCPMCGSTELSVRSTEKMTVVDVPEPLPYTVREHVINRYKCNGCGVDGLLPESARTELPSSSSSSSSVEAIAKNGVVLGKNALSTISLLWSVARLPLRKISYALETLHGLRLSPATIGHALQRVSERLARFHESVRGRVNTSKRANFDETGVSVAGRKGWIWVAATDAVAFVQVAMSRGRDVLERYFSEFKGVATVDGWKPYRYFSIIQRCWGHILREAEALSLRARDKEEALRLLLSLRSIFHETKNELREHPPPNQELHDRMLRRLRYLLSKRYRDADVVRLVSKLKEASRDLFTFTLHPGVQPTNNHAERQLKEPIVHRKIRGQLKSEEGMTVFSRLMTAMSTWKLQGLNPFLEFRRYV